MAKTVVSNRPISYNKLGGEDAEYKEKIGRKWQELAGKGYIFDLVEKDRINTIMERLTGA